MGETAKQAPFLKPPPELGQRSVKLECPQCRQMVFSKIHKKPSDLAWSVGLAIAFVG